MGWGTINYHISGVNVREEKEEEEEEEGICLFIYLFICLFIYFMIFIYS